jgi:hypothetical protein
MDPFPAVDLLQAAAYHQETSDRHEHLSAPMRLLASRGDPLRTTFPISFSVATDTLCSKDHITAIPMTS